MKNSKLTKLLCLLLVAVLAFSLAACGAKTDDSAEEEKKTEEKTEEKKEEKKEDVNEQVVNEAAKDSNIVRSGTEDPEVFAANRKESSKDTLVIRLSEEGGTIDAITSGWAPGGFVTYNLTGCNLLREYFLEEGGMDFGIDRYSLFDSMEYDDDFMGCTYHIRENAVFHNGNPVTAEDVIFCIQRWSFNATYCAMIDFENIQAIDDHTLYVKRLNSNSSFYSIIGRMTRIFEKASFQEAEANGTLVSEYFFGNPGTCGLYEIVEWKAGDQIVMKADPKFYAPANIENLIIRIIPDNTVAMMELETGGVDILHAAGSADILNVVAGQYGDQIYALNSMEALQMFFGFNMSKEFFEDINVRLAIVHSIDWHSVVENAWGILGGDPHYLNAGTYLYQKDISDWWQGLYDPDLALECWNKTDKVGGSYELTMFINNQDAKVTACEMIIKYLEPLGITLKIENYDTATWADMLQNSPDAFDLYIRDFGGNGMGWGSFWSTTGRLTVTNGHCDIGPESIQKESKELIDLGEAHRNAVDPAVSQEIGDQITDGVTSFKWLYAIPLSQNYATILYNSELKNWGIVNNCWNIADAYFE